MFMPGDYFIGVYLPNHQAMIQKRHRENTSQSSLTCFSWRRKITPQPPVHLTNNEKLAQKHPNIKVPESLLCQITYQLMDHPIAIKLNSNEVVYIDRFLLPEPNPKNPFTGAPLLKDEISEQFSEEKLREINAFKRQHYNWKVFCFSPFGR